MSGERVAVAICLIVVLVGCAVGLLGCTQGRGHQRDEIFARTIAAGVTLNEGLELVLGNPQSYIEDGWIDILVLNHTGRDLCFENNAFGVRGFVFDEGKAQWERIDLGFIPAPPGLRCVSNEASDFYEISTGFPVRRMDVRAHSEVRLFVVGYTGTLVDGTPVPEGYGAYLDIRIAEGGTVVPTPTAIAITPFPTP